MKNTELTEKRDSDLVFAYYAAIKKLGKNAPYVSKRAVLRNVISEEAPRFYCSVEEASRVCSQIIRGRVIPRKGLKGEMYKDLSEIVKRKMSENCVQTMRTAIMEAIEEPAPRWYVCWKYGTQIIYKHLKNKNRK